MTILLTITERQTYMFVLVIAIICSIAGVVFAVATGDASHGGRGGAVGVAFSFFALFASRSYGDDLMHVFGKDAEDLLELLAEEDDQPKNTTDNKVERLNRTIDLLTEKLKIDSLGQKRQNIFLAFSGAISTIFWGFGDVISCWFIQ